MYVCIYNVNECETAYIIQWSIRVVFLHDRSELLMRCLLTPIDILERPLALLSHVAFFVSRTCTDADDKQKLHTIHSTAS
jgi:hypothetical protein